MREEDNQPEREIIVPAEIEFEKEENEQDEYVTGDWYWVQFDDEDEEDLVCIVAVGSNYVKVKGPFVHNTRIHITEFPDCSRPAPDYKEYINKQVAHERGNMQKLLDKAKDLTRRLGVTPQTLLTEEEKRAPEDRSLAVLSDAPDPNEYKNALIKLKEDDLPEIFGEMRKANERLAAWMGSEVIALNSQLKIMESAKDQIDGKIFNVSIYAGLQENVYHFAKGEPAPFHEKLHVMQRKLYMDEECLLNYELGGMEFKHINDFNAWLAKPDNRDRILPHQRCMAVMQVRRKEKYRPSFGNIGTAMINMHLAEKDTSQFIYIRNGENLYCIATDLEFPSKTFPDKDILNLTEPQYANVDWKKVKLIPERRYEEARKKYERDKRQYRKQYADFIRWNRANGVKDPKSTFSADVHPANPFYDFHELREPRFEFSEYKKFDDDNLYFDDIKEHIQKEAEKYNRIALIIQGILDRSEILHPHPRICIWKASDFNACIKLVYDHDYVLYDGDPPDIAAYLYENNQKIGKGSVVFGQDDYWLDEVERKERERYRKIYDDDPTYLSRSRPFGDPGPGKITKIEEWKPRARKAVFRWKRERRTYSRWGSDDPIPCSITVPADRLFNISAYKPGDYKQFFQDPRTRENYLKWAPVMLLAEEIHAGNYDPELNSWTSDREAGFTPDGHGGRVRVRTFKGVQVTETRGGLYSGTSYEYGDHFEGPEYVEDED